MKVYVHLVEMMSQTRIFCKKHIVVGGCLFLFASLHKAMSFISRVDCQRSAVSITTGERDMSRPSPIPMVLVRFFLSSVVVSTSAFHARVLSSSSWVCFVVKTI